MKMWSSDDTHNYAALVFFWLAGWSTYQWWPPFKFLHNAQMEGEKSRWQDSAPHFHIRLTLRRWWWWGSFRSWATGVCQCLPSVTSASALLHPPTHARWEAGRISCPTMTVAFVQLLHACWTCTRSLLKGFISTDALIHVSESLAIWFVWVHICLHGLR